MHTNQLREYIERRELVCIRRAFIEESSMQGFLLAFSDRLLLFQYVYDFRLDGYLIVRRSDVTELSCRDTDRFQRELLEAEGVIERIDFEFSAPIQSFDSFLSSRPANEIVIVEDEVSDPQEFLIGTVSHVANDAVHINHFTGTASRSDPPEQLDTNRITSCRTSTSYIWFYERYFERLSQAT
jgi:hypothetical protein